MRSPFLMMDRMSRGAENWGTCLAGFVAVASTLHEACPWLSTRLMFEAVVRWRLPENPFRKRRRALAVEREAVLRWRLPESPFRKGHAPDPKDEARYFLRSGRRPLRNTRPAADACGVDGGPGGNSYHTKPHVSGNPAVLPILMLRMVTS